AGADGGAERGTEAALALAEIDLREDGLGGGAVLGGEGDVGQQVVVADLEVRHVEFLRPFVAPMPDGMHDAETGAAQAVGRTNAPGEVLVLGKAGEAGLDLPAALLVEPVETVEFDEFAGEDVAQLEQVPDVERGVVEELGGEGALGPVGLLPG